MTPLNTPVLVLNQNFEPLNVCNARRAFVLVGRGKAEVVQASERILRGVSSVFSIPSVIRMVYFIHRPRPQARLSRREVFARDHHTCQYCGKRTHDLTLDHVLPRHRGGPHSWENLVSACRRCNHHKAGRTPTEARMTLRRKPKRPRATLRIRFGRYLDNQPHWDGFVRGWDREEPLSGVAAGA